MYFVGLNVARGIAAFLVLLAHASLSSNVFYGGEPFFGFWKFGGFGVDFFFVLSGFIIYWVHADESKSMASMSRYFKKRIIRIYPPF